MRPVLCGLAAASVVLHASIAAAQQGTVVVSGAAQSVVGSPERVAGEHRHRSGLRRLVDSARA